MDSEKGQSLMDILVGTAIGVILIFAAVSAIAPALKTGTQAASTQTAAWLASGLLDNVKAWTDADWHNILGVATGTTNKYFLITSSSPYVATSGIESIMVSSTVYSRYFYVSDVFRVSSGSITTSGGSYDPSTKQVTVVSGWTAGTTSTVSEYLTRNRENVYNQTDWTSGTTTDPNAVVSSVNYQFASSTNINFGGTPGSIIVTGH